MKRNYKSLVKKIIETIAIIFYIWVNITSDTLIWTNINSTLMTLDHELSRYYENYHIY